MTYNSTFQDRAAQAAKAKQAALEQLRSRPPVDEKQAKARMVAGAEREAAKAEKAVAKKAERKAADDAAAADAAADRGGAKGQARRALCEAEEPQVADAGGGGVDG